MCDIEELCKETAKSLFAAYEAKERLIFPSKDSKSRVSEQEARFLCCKTLEDEKCYFYSVETPTKNKYSFGKEIKDLSIGTGRSGSVDLSLYNEIQDFNKEGGASSNSKQGAQSNYLQPAVNIEFKAHSSDPHSIAKDLFKLIYENANGVFFHLLEKCAKNGHALIQNYEAEIDYKTGKLKDKKDQGIVTKYKNICKCFKGKGLLSKSDQNEDKNYITFAICCLDPQFLIMKTISKEEFKEVDCSDFFRLGLENIKNKIKIGCHISSPNSWEIVLPDA